MDNLFSFVTQLFEFHVKTNGTLDKAPKTMQYSCILQSFVYSLKMQRRKESVLDNLSGLVTAGRLRAGRAAEGGTLLRPE